MMKQMILFCGALTVLLLSCSNDGGPTASGPSSPGEMIYDTHCTLCHGGDGKLKMGGAKDLSVSPISREEMIAVVTHGRGTMMPYKHVLSAKEIEAVVDHVLTLKAKE